MFRLFISLTLVLVLASCASDDFTDKRIVRVWQSGPAHYGKQPEDRCLLAIDEKSMSSREFPKGHAVVVPYKIVVQNADFIVAEVAAARYENDPCLYFGEKSYMRFEDQSHSVCLAVYGANNKCPNKPLGVEGFGLNIYRTKEEAITRGGSPKFWAVFFPYVQSANQTVEGTPRDNTARRPSLPR